MFLQYFATMFRANLGRLREERDRGAVSIELAILIGVLVVAATGFGLFLANKLAQKENAIQ